MAMNETCNSTHCDFWRSTTCNEEKSIYRVSIPKRKNAALSWWNSPSIINPTPGSSLITLGKSAISRTQNWFLLLADWALTSDCGQVALVNGRPCYKTNGGITSTPVWLTTLSTFLWGITSLVGERDWVVYIEKVILATWVGLWGRLSAEEWMLLNCGVGEDSWESLGL